MRYCLYWNSHFRQYITYWRQCLWRNKNHGFWTQQSDGRRKLQSRPWNGPHVTRSWNLLVSDETWEICVQFFIYRLDGPILKCYVHFFFDQVFTTRMFCRWQKSTKNIFQSGRLECWCYILPMSIWQKSNKALNCNCINWKSYTVILFVFSLLVIINLKPQFWKRIQF